MRGEPMSASMSRIFRTENGIWRQEPATCHVDGGGSGDAGDHVVQARKVDGRVRWQGLGSCSLARYVTPGRTLR